MSTLNLVREYRTLEQRSMKLKGARLRLSQYVMARLWQEIQRRAKEAEKAVGLHGVS